MILKRIIQNCLALIILSNFAFANVDSLQKTLKYSFPDTAKVNKLNLLSKQYKDTDAEKGLEYGLSALKLAIKLNYKNGIGYAHNNIGLNYWRMGVYDLTLENYFKALDIFETLKNSSGLATTNNNIGLIYFAHSQYEKAIVYLEKSIELSTVLKNKIDVSRSQHNLGLVYNELKQHNLSLRWHLKSLKGCIGADSILTASNYCFIGRSYSFLKQYDSAYYYLQKSVNLFEKYNNLNNLAMAQNQIALYFNHTKNYKKAIEYARKAQELGKRIGNKYMIMESLGLISNAYKGLKQFEKAYDYHVLFKDAQDSLFNEDNLQSITRKETQHTYEKIFQKLEEEKNSQLLKQKVLTRTAIVLVVVLFLIAIIIYLFYRSKSKVNKLLAAKNEEISKQKEDLSLLNAQLLESNTEKDRFFSIIAHDLKSPFSGFLSMTKMMTENSSLLSAEDMQELGGTMQKSANNLFKLLENLLEWSRIQRGTTEFNPDNCNLYMLIKNNIDIQASTASQKQLKILNLVPEDVQIFADVSMINTVIRNLLSNAIKFSHRGGMIEIGTKRDVENNSNVVYIKDEGIGMSSFILKNIFRLDQKVSRPGAENEPSTGLGLVLCKEFINKHTGKIWAESEEGKGTTFFFTLGK